MIGYDITSMSQCSLMGVKALLSTTSFMTLNERISLILNGDEFEISESVMEMKPDCSPLLTTIKYSMAHQAPKHQMKSCVANLQL
jgi:hypothetical protein